MERQRNPGQTFPLAMPSPHFASLHAGYGERWRKEKIAGTSVPAIRAF
jgi:hypothetical protein